MNNFSQKPIYTGTYSSRKRKGWKRVFIIILLLQLILLLVFYVKNKLTPAAEVADSAVEAITPLPLKKVLPEANASSEVIDAVKPHDLQAVITAYQRGELNEALQRIQPLLANPSPEIIELLGKINIQRLQSNYPMKEKIFYTVQSGDYLQKIARKYNTTIALIKKINGMQTDTIRIGERLSIFTGAFDVEVSKSKNTLDLLLHEQLFKRYAVGTGEFGKTPAVSFIIYDKIIEPPWTRPADNRQIEYGDPENVLGTRWMALRAPSAPELSGFGIHGTWERESIGFQSSAGCVRMYNEDVEELFDLLPRKSVVTIID
jgi:lipoprotein-anchoring transpeptidase ErfK/SrfK